jgi:hypothetical protein
MRAVSEVAGVNYRNLRNLRSGGSEKKWRVTSNCGVLPEN